MPPGLFMFITHINCADPNKCCFFTYPAKEFIVHKMTELLMDDYLEKQAVMYEGKIWWTWWEYSEFIRNS
jgi:hypothetical protein